MTHAQWIEHRYFDLFAKVAELQAYLMHGGDEIDHIRSIVDDAMPLMVEEAA